MIAKIVTEPANKTVANGKPADPNLTTQLPLRDMVWMALEKIAARQKDPDQLTAGARHVLDMQLHTLDWDQTQLEEWTYDNGARLVNIDRPTIDETRVYDLADRLESISNPDVGTMDYTWDENSNKLSETWDGVMSPWSFTTQKADTQPYPDGYDPEDRFRRFIQSGQNLDKYMDRSEIGNIFDIQTNGSSLLRDFGLAHELVQVDTSDQQFDANGNVTRTHTGTRLSWDFDDQLSESDATAVYQYEYNALGQRVRKGNDVYIWADPGNWGGGNCIAEYQQVSGMARLRNEYIYADGIDSLVMIYRENANQRLLAVRNQQWSVVALSDLATGNVVERYSYDEFGQRTVLNAAGVATGTISAYDNPYGYTSRRHDNETKLMYFRARFYDPTTGEFTARDPLEYVDGMSMMRGYFIPNTTDPAGSLSKKKHEVFIMACGKTSTGSFDWETEASANSGIVVQKIQAECFITPCKGDPYDRNAKECDCDEDCKADFTGKPDIVYYEAWDLATERRDSWEFPRREDCGGFWVWAEARYYPRLTIDVLKAAGWERGKEYRPFYGCTGNPGNLLSINGERRSTHVLGAIGRPHNTRTRVYDSFICL